MEDDPFIKNDENRTGVHSILYDSRDHLKIIKDALNKLNTQSLANNGKFLSAPELEERIFVLILAIKDLSDKLSDFIKKQEEKKSSDD
jgi:hypothetical protein